MAANVHKKTDSAARRGLLLSRAAAFFAPEGACLRPAAVASGRMSGLPLCHGRGLSLRARASLPGKGGASVGMLKNRYIQPARQGAREGGCRLAMRNGPFGIPERSVSRSRTVCLARQNGRFLQVSDIQVVAQNGADAPPFAKNHDTHGCRSSPIGR